MAFRWHSSISVNTLSQRIKLEIDVSGRMARHPSFDSNEKKRPLEPEMAVNKGKVALGKLNYRSNCGSCTLRQIYA